MEISNEYKSRHGFADFEYNLFQITSGENIVETCNLVKVPKYTYTNTYVEKICEGNGWYSKGAEITEQITHDFYWLVVLNSKCLGVINENEKSNETRKPRSGSRDAAGLPDSLRLQIRHHGCNSFY